MPSGSPVGRRPLGLLVAAALLLSAVAGALAGGALGRPFPSLLVDPWAVVSLVERGPWGATRLGLGHRDRIVAVDGEPLGPGAGWVESPARRLGARVAAAAAAGRSQVVLTVARDGAERAVIAPLGRLDLVDGWLLFAVYLLAGWLTLWSGIVVAHLGGEGSAVRAYLAWSGAAFVLLACLFDYHTTTRLAPLFTLSTLALPVAALWLAYGFPSPPKGLPWLAWVLWSVSVVAALGALVALVAPLVGGSARLVRQGVDIFLVPCLLSLPVAGLLRFRSAAPADRAALRAAALGLLLIPVLLGGSLALSLAADTDLLHLLLPFAVIAIPLSVGAALIRHNLLESVGALRRWMFLPPLVCLALLFASALGLLTQRFAATAPGSAPLLVFAAALVALLASGWAALERLLFVAMQHFRPTVEELADQVAGLRDEGAIRAGLAALVGRFLPVASSRVVAAEEAERGLPEADRPRLRTGELVFSADPPRRRRLYVPMRSGGALRAALEVAPKAHGGLFTADELDLLRTVAGLGALALHNAQVVAELERVREGEIDATRGEKRQAIDLLAAELSHEIQYSLNFFRYLLGEAEGGQPLQGEDVTIGREEAERLGRMLAALRRLRLPPPERRPLGLREPIRRAVDLLRGPCRAKGLTVEQEVDPELFVEADPDALVQLFANLLRNAADAVPAGGRLGVTAHPDEDGLRITVWDDGPGIDPALAGRLFNPWATTKVGGSGLGLAVSQRLVRSFGWALSFERRQDRTCFTITVPSGTLPAAPR